MHYLLHLSRYIKRTRLNMGVLGAVWGEESFLGKLKKIGVRCHSATVMKRVFGRYLLLQGLRFRDTRLHAQLV